jgi:actin-like ATPase involved in cell morphogenesis
VTHVLGIDLGGTAVSAAIADDDGRVEMVALGDRSTTVPSVVHRRDVDSLVTGELAARRAAGDPSHAAWSIRRRLGDPAPVLLGDDAVPAGDLLAAILRDVLARVTAVRGLEAARVVLTHPAGWGPYRRGLFEDVVAAAGLEDAVTMADPEAAGHQHRAVHGLDDGTALAVHDVGGSSVEASVLTRRGQGLEIVGSPVGIERLGGVDLDEAVIALVDEATGGLLADLDPDDDTNAPALARLRQDCVEAKEALSTDDEAIVSVLLPGRNVDVTVARDAFEERIRPAVARSVEALERAVASARVRPSAVLLIGGSARVPLVGRTVGERLGLPVIVDPRPEEVVALGAARAAQAAAPSVTRVTSMVGAEPAGRSGSGRSTRAAGAGGAASTASSSSASASVPASAPTSESSEAASSEPPEQEPDEDQASTTLVPSPIVDGRVAAGTDESRTTVTRTPPTPDVPSDDARTTVTRTAPAEPAETTVVRPTPSTGTPATGTPAAGTPATGRPAVGSPPPRRPAGGTPPPPRQAGRPAPPSGSFRAQGRPGGPGPGGPGPGGPHPRGPGQGGPGQGGPRPGWPPGPPGGRPGGPPGGPPHGRPMTGPFPPGAPGPSSPPAAGGPTRSGGRTRTVVLVVAGVVVLLLLVAALVLTGVL